MRVYEYLPRMLHAKTIAVDGGWAALGTANLEYRGLFVNYEPVLAVGDAAICGQLEQ